MLSQEQIRTLWPQIKTGLRNLWGRLDEEELDRTNGDFSAITALVQGKYSESREEIQEKVDILMESYDNDTDKGLDPDVSSYQRSPIVNEDWTPRH